MGEKIFASNRKARFEYFIEQEFSAGLALLGSEVKSIVSGRMNINDAYIVERNGELFIQNSHVAENPQTGRYFQHEPDRLRKLLLHKKEMAQIITKINEKGYSAVVLKVYSTKNKIKAEIAICKGKNLVDKRQTIKEREGNIEVRRAMKGEY